MIRNGPSSSPQQATVDRLEGWCPVSGSCLPGLRAGLVLELSLLPAQCEELRLVSGYLNRLSRAAVGLSLEKLTLQLVIGRYGLALARWC